MGLSNCHTNHFRAAVLHDPWLCSQPCPSFHSSSRASVGLPNKRMSSEDIRFVKRPWMKANEREKRGNGVIMWGTVQFLLPGATGTMNAFRQEDINESGTSTWAHERFTALTLHIVWACTAPRTCFSFPFFFFFIKLPSSCSPSNASWLCMRNCRGPGHQKRVLWNWSAQWLGVPGGAEVVEMLQRFQESGNLYTRGSLPRVLHRAAMGQTTDPQHYSCGVRTQEGCCLFGLHTVCSNNKFPGQRLYLHHSHGSLSRLPDYISFAPIHEFFGHILNTLSIDLLR